jgi:quercetin dioxygenase-like cupin family protein
MISTIRIEPEQMQARIARFDALKPLPIQLEAEVSQAARDVIYARELLSVIGLEASSRTPINARAPIVGAGGMTMTLAVCPPGQGPELHVHRRTFETFTVLSGSFEVRWNDDGAQSVRLERFDTISVPPGVCRAFRNVGEGEGILQVIITGGVHDMEDIDFARGIGERIDALQPGARARFEAQGFSFTAAPAAKDDGHARG